MFLNISFYVAVELIDSITKLLKRMDKLKIP